MGASGFSFGEEDEFCSLLPLATENSQLRFQKGQCNFLITNILNNYFN